MTEEQKPEETQKEPVKKMSILEKAQHKVDVDLGLKEKDPDSDIRSPQARARMRKMKQIRKMILWGRRSVYIFAVFVLVYLFSRYSFYTFKTFVSEFEKGDKVMLDTFISDIPLISESPQLHDKIAFRIKPNDPAISIGRVYATAGKNIAFQKVEDLYFLKINGEIDRDAPALSKEEAETCTGTVPEGHYFVLDDTNTDDLFAVFDSRQAGFIPQANVFARVTLVWSRVHNKEE